MRWLIMLIWPVLFTSIAAAAETQPSPTETERVLLRWDFTSAKDTLGWQAQHSVAPLELKDGALVVRCVGFDPYFASPDFELDTNDFQYIRLKLRSSAGGHAELFYALENVAGSARFTGEWRMPFSLRRVEDWTTVTVLPFWKPGQKVFRIRFDPPSDDAVWEIAEVAIVQRLPSTPSPLPEYRFDSPGDAAAWLPGQDVASMDVDKGALLVRGAGREPILVGPPCSLQASERNILSLRAKSTGAKEAELWYSSDAYSEFNPAMRVSFALIPDGEFHSYNVALNRARGFLGDIKRIALALPDSQPDSEIAIDFLAVGSKPMGPAGPSIDSFTVGRTVAYQGEDVTLTCRVSNQGGEDARDLILALKLPDGAKLTSGEMEQPVPPIAPMAEVAARWTVQFPEMQTADSLVVKVQLISSGTPLAAASASALVSRKVPPPEGETPVGFRVSGVGDWILQNRFIRLVFPMNAYGQGVIEIWAKAPDAWKKMGVIPSLGRLIYLSANGEQVSYDVYASRATLIRFAQREMGLSLDLAWRDPEARIWTFSYLFELGEQSKFASLSCKLSVDRPAEVLSFSFPEFLAGDGSFGEERDLGFFPGLEYLLPGERSSGTDFCAPEVANRLAPHPYKITIPLMAVIRDGMAAGLIWDPLQKWDGEAIAPAAKFASPNFVTPGANHLMGLFLPSIPKWTKENSLIAEKPYELPAGKSLALSSFLFAAEGTDFDSIFSVWLDIIGGLPASPPLPYESYDSVFQAILAGYAKVTWDEKARGWHRALTDPWEASYDSEITLHLTWALNAGLDMPADLRSDVERVLGEARGERKAPDRWARYLEGPLQGYVETLLAGEPGQWRQIRPDGTAPFEPDDEHSILGQKGDTSSGHTGNSLMPIWEAARYAGKSKLVETGLLGLKYLDTQVRPEGAQVWELQLHVPDVLASAKIIPCYVAAYELLGDKRYIEEARKWAYRGLPFIYFWNPPDRPIMRYGSIPVFGATWFTGGWFGRIVQWNGLEYADALLRLAKYDDSLDWRLIARGIVMSAIQQMRPLDHSTYSLKDYIPDCGHIGMYPDAYSAVEGDDAYHWCLSGKRIMDLLLDILGRSPDVKITVLRPSAGADVEPAHIGSVAYIENAVYDAKSLQFSVRLEPLGTAHRLFIFGTPEPKAIKVGGSALQPVDDTEGSPEAYAWQHGIILLKLKQAENRRDVRIDF